MGEKQSRVSRIHKMFTDEVMGIKKNTEFNTDIALAKIEWVKGPQTSLLYLSLDRGP